MSDLTPEQDLCVFCTAGWNEWALPLHVRWTYLKDDVFSIQIQFLCFCVNYERWHCE